MTNVLIVLSPLASNLLSPTAAVPAARALRQKGASRADLAIDPRLQILLDGRAHYHTLPNFTPVARNLSAQIFAPVVGQSDVQDLSNSLADYALKTPPDLKSLSTAGSLFVNTSSGDARTEGDKLGLVFYAAIHAVTPERKPYTHMIFPSMNNGTHHRLSAIFGETREENLDPYGPLISLAKVRRVMAALQTPQAKPAMLNEKSPANRGAFLKLY